MGGAASNSANTETLQINRFQILFRQKADKTDTEENIALGMIGLCLLSYVYDVYHLFVWELVDLYA